MFKTLGILFILMGFAGIGHHYWVCGRLWDKGQLLGIHHEPLVVICFAVGLTTMLIRRANYEDTIRVQT